MQCLPGAGRCAACAAVSPRSAPRRFGPCQAALSKPSSSRARRSLISGATDLRCHRRLQAVRLPSPAGASRDTGSRLGRAQPALPGGKIVSSSSGNRSRNAERGNTTAPAARTAASLSPSTCGPNASTVVPRPTIDRTIATGSAPRASRSTMTTAHPEPAADAPPTCPIRTRARTPRLRAPRPAPPALAPPPPPVPA